MKEGKTLEIMISKNRQEPSLPRRQAEVQEGRGSRARRLESHLLDPVEEPAAEQRGVLEFMRQGEDHVSYWSWMSRGRVYRYATAKRPMPRGAWPLAQRGDLSAFMPPPSRGTVPRMTAGLWARPGREGSAPPVALESGTLAGLFFKFTSDSGCLWSLCVYWRPFRPKCTSGGGSHADS